MAEGLTRQEFDEALAPYFDTLNRTIRETLAKLPEPKVTVLPPKVDVPKVEVSVPEISLPEITIPKIEVPDIHVPRPEVTVNVDAVRVKNWPEFPRPEPFDDSRIVKELKKLEQKTGGASGPTEYKNAGGYGTHGLFGSVPMWDDNGVTRAASLLYPIPVDQVNQLVDEDYDYISLGYTGSNLTTVIYKSGGSGGTTVATLTLGYSGSTLTSVTKT